MYLNPPPLDLTLTLTYYQLPVVELGEGWVCSCLDLRLI